MKLAEALLIRSDMQKKLAQLKGRIRLNAKVQEGDSPAEDPNALLVESNQIIGELAKLITRIHRTNAGTCLEDGRPLIELLVARDTLESRHKLLLEAIEATQHTEERYSYREIKWNVILSVGGLQKQADDLAKKLRDLNLKIQAQNWQVDLLE